MARMTNRLSDTTVRTKKKPGYVADGGNLYLRIAPGGTKGWIFRYAINGRTRDAGFGPYPTISLQRAREKADQWRQQLVEGVDPLQARDKRRAAAQMEAARATTFKQCAEAFMASHEKGWRGARTAKQLRGALQSYVFPIMGDLQVQAVDVGLVLQAVEPIWHEKPRTATVVRSAIERILDFAKARGQRTGDNPAAWRGNLKHLLPDASKVRAVKHHAAMPYAEMPAFMAKVRAHRDGGIPLGLEFMILTAARLTEALEARWDEFDLDAGLWTIPPERMKEAEAHRVPLSPRAVEILEEMAKLRINEFVFPGLKPGRPLSEMPVRRLIKKLHHDTTITRHGFRSSFRDWAAEETDFPNHVVEMALAHAIESKVEAAYRRGELLEKRRKLMEAWASYCQRAPASVKRSSH